MTSEGNQKQQHFFPHASRSLLCIRFVAVAFRSEEVRWRRGPPVTYFCPALDPPLGGSGQKTTTLVRDHEYFIPTKFHQNPSSGSVEEVENVKSLRRTDDGRQTDGRTDDGRCTMTIAHSSLRLRWAKNHIPLTKMSYFSEFLSEIMQSTRKRWTRDQNIDSYEEISFFVKIYCFYQKLKWSFEKFWCLRHMV